MILVIGEVLFDVFPDYKRIGGAPFNFAYHVSSMNIPTRLITRIGTDTEGRLAKNHLVPLMHSMTDVQVDQKHPTGRVIVELNEQGEPSYNILADVAYDYIEYDDNLRQILDEKPELIYFGSLAQRSEHGFRTVQEILGSRSARSKCFYDVNLRQDCYSEKIIRSSLEHTDILKLNRDELLAIKEMFGFTHSESDFSAHLIEKYALSMISMTLGANGSCLITPEGVFDIPGPANIEIVDTVGAGDAYSAIVALGYIQGWQPQKILESATRFSAAVCGLEGAVPADRSFYDNFLK